MIHRASFEEQAAHDLERYRGVFLISKECGENSCESLVKIRAIMSEAANDPMLLENGQQALKLLADGIPVNILCEARQHLVTTQSLREYSDLKLMMISDIGYI
jgi:hypothetical protein